MNTGEEFVGAEIAQNDEFHNSSFIIHNFAVSPNPFNPTTAISFTLQAASLVKLEVFDVNGRNVGAKLASPLSGSGATPTTGYYPAGTHSITFDGSNLPSGIYFAKLTAGEFTAVQKMVLMK